MVIPDFPSSPICVTLYTITVGGSLTAPNRFRVPTVDEI